MLKKIWIFKNMIVELRGLFENVTVRIRIFENMIVQEQMLPLGTNNTEMIKYLIYFFSTFIQLLI